MYYISSCPCWKFIGRENQSIKVNIWSAVPLPCFSLFSDFQIVSRAAAPEGPVEYRGYFFCPSVCLSVRPAICFLSYCICWLGLWLGGSCLETLAWPRNPSLEAQAWILGGLQDWRPWPGGPTLEALAQPAGLEALAWGSWPRGPGLEALAWGPWPRSPGLVILARAPRQI